MGNHRLQACCIRAWQQIEGVGGGLDDDVVDEDDDDDNVNGDGLTILIAGRTFLLSRLVCISSIIATASYCQLPCCCNLMNDNNLVNLVIKEDYPLQQQ